MPTPQPPRSYGALIDRYAAAPPHDPAALVDAIAKRVEAALEMAGDRGPEPLLDVKGVARRLAVSVRLVETLVSEGELVPIRIRNARRFTPESVEQIVRRSARTFGRV